jgi:hypothetical protein
MHTKRVLHNHDTNAFYEGSAIFVRLPTHGFKATCMLYTYITRNQFPSSSPSTSSSSCPKTNEKNKYLVNLIGTIGYFNFFHPLIENFIGALHNDRILLTPRAWDQGEFNFPETVIKSSDGKITKAKDPWATWADVKECDLETYAYNPWNCHYISLSSCNNAELHDVPWGGSDFRLPDPDSAASVNSRYLRYMRDKIVPARFKYLDSPQLNGTWTWMTYKNSEWEYTRIMQFIQRPVIQLRARIRRSLRNYIQLSASTVPTTTTRSLPGNRPHHLKMETCVAMHVRHGDSRADDRSESGINRSLSAHVNCASDLLRDLGGISNIFLATDDPNLQTLAPKQFPQYNWFMQQRTLRDTSELYDFHFEKSKQQDIAGIITDGILSARCIGMIGSFDSGFVDQLYQLQCGKSDMGVCPPMKDLLKCQGVALDYNQDVKTPHTRIRH